ncbi:MAG: hypothetical protein QM754_12730 [Tepidisphaeraceae bacterium]
MKILSGQVAVGSVREKRQFVYRPIRPPLPTAHRPLPTLYSRYEIRPDQAHARPGGRAGRDPRQDRPRLPACQPHRAGRIKVRRGKGDRAFKVQYTADQRGDSTGLKCQYLGPGTVQEVFLICTDAAAARQWLIDSGIATGPDSNDE